MIILDTNVVSEPMKSDGSLVVQAWLNRQTIETLYITATSLSELLVGVRTMPEGKRKRTFDSVLQQLLANFFGARVLAFDQRAAVAYASLIGQARARGYTHSMADAQIAAIAITHGCVVATRDTAPFVAAGVPVVNPWDQ
jgi:toxin FitB